MAAEFKIGRLRFTWQGPWTTNTAYIKDAIVSYQGKTYVCLIANTSNGTNFYNDLYYVTPSGASTPLWNLIIDGKTFTGTWTSGTAYSLGNIAIFGGQIYYCNTNHTSTSFASQSTYWTLYTQFPNWHVSWTINTVYGIGDVVKYGGIVYQCTANHTSAATTALGLESNQAAWKVFYSGVEYKNTWIGSTRYKVNDLVKLGDNIYQCITYNSDATFTPANWNLWLPGQEYAPTNPWVSGTIYQLGDTVDYGGYTYISKVVNNIGNDPSLSPLSWSLFTQGFAFSGDWNNSTLYIVGNIVRRHGRLYSVNANNSGQDPAAFSIATTYIAAGSSGTTLNVTSGSGIKAGMYINGTGFTQGQTVVSVSGNTVILSAVADSTVTLTNGQTLNFVGINYSYWNLVVPGAYWTKTWVNGTAYTIGDIAVWQNTTYVCVQNHTASLTGSGAGGNNRPDNDTTNIYWVIYVTHARKNAMNTQGDLEYYTSASSGYTALPIGSNSYTLRSTSNTPTWTNINTVTNVYYVCATTGQNAAGYGSTWDRPFKSIAYACNLVSAGTQYPNTVALLNANKSWILAEMVQWANYQITNNISPYTSSYVFDSVKAARDAGYIIDAIAYDLGRGGNSQTVAAALAFFAFGQKNIFFSSAVAIDVPYYLPMLNYLTTLIGYSITQSAPPSSYQVINNIAPVIYQNASLGSAEFTGATSATTLINYIISALTTQSTAALPPPNTGVSITIFVKTGTYSESLPITVPENTAIVGDELRGSIVQPAIRITTTSNISDASTNKFTVGNVSAMADQMPVMFATTNILNVIGTTYSGFGGITTGQKYYIVGSTINTSTKQFGITGCTGTYTYLTALNTNSTGTNATFTVTPLASGNYSVSISYAGTGYATNDTLRIIGATVGAQTIIATSIVSGSTYTIVSLGTTDFRLIGASANTIGLSFTATNTFPLGTGTVNLSINDINITVSTITGSGLTGGIATISNTGSTIVQLTTYTGGSMAVYAGDSLKDMFRLRNGTGLRNMTLNGLLGTLGGIDSFGIQRPTGGSYACLDPGTGPDDTTAWIFRRSPYVQNVTAFGDGCTALKIDGNLHNGGNKSIVCNDFTHIVNDGIGIWCTGPGSLTEAVSVFSYYGYSGYMAEAGGRIRATNGNSSYGVYGVIATGYDITETPATGIIYNQSSQIQATIQSSFGTAAQLLRLSFANAGSNYNSMTTNMLNFSNNFLGANWTSDGNVVFAKNTTSLTGNTEAWSLQGLTSGPDGSYVYQNVSVPASGYTYTNVSAVNVSGSGLGAVFTITVTSTSYIVVPTSGGSGYVSGNQLFVAGGSLGGVNSVNDCIITVFSTGSSASILTVTSSGTVPINSALNYTMSIYIKQGTATNIDLHGIFSGSSSVTSTLNYNFVTGVVTPGSANGGLLPIRYGVINQAISATGNSVGWYRLWMTVNDTTGLNTNLQFKLYPRGYNGTSGQYSYVYGSQLELSKSTYTPNFYLEVVSTSKYSAYANLNITGSGTGVVTIADETRSASVFQTYVTTDQNGITGGAGYLTASNNAQSGTNQFIQLALADTNTNANYTGMRVFINSGTGAGQYGYISYFDSRTTGLTPKYAYVLKESFKSLQIISSNQGTGLFTLASANTSTLYLNQPVQFIPTYFTAQVSSTNLAQTTVTVAYGGTSNYLVCTSTAGLTVNMGVTFTNGSGSIFSNLVAGYIYYISAIISPTTFQISANFAGTTYPLNNGTGTMVLNYIANTNYLQASTINMVVNYPIQFTGTALGGVIDSTVYYISDIIDTSNFTISTTLVPVTVTATTAGTNALSVSSTSSLVPLNPILFTSTVFDNIVDNQKYYISRIINSTQFTVSSSLITVNMTATATGTNLITVTSTTGFVANSPINFIGTSWELNIASGTVYYIQAINNATSFTISQTPGGSAVTMSGGSGIMTARTCPASFTLAGATGSMIGTSTNGVKTLTLSPSGSMTATFSTSLFGGSNVTIGQTYYVQSIPSVTGTTFAVSLNLGTVSGTSTTASPISIVTKTGSMNVAAVGWDHINPGTQIQAVLDNSSLYFIEPKLSYSPPGFNQSAYTSAVGLSLGSVWSSMAYGNGYWIALANAGQTAAVSSDGLTWTSITLPSAQTWSAIAYGNGYWVAIASGYGYAAVSKSNGAGWRTFALPSSTTWSSITYGNGIFVAIATGTNTAAYSTNYGTTWSSATLPGSNLTWSSVTYGNGIFVVVASGSSTSAYSATGSSWTSSTLPFSSTWSSITYGQQTFVAVSSSSKVPAYSQDGKTWSSSNIAISATVVVYGQGVFTALNSGSTTAYTSEDCLQWTQQTVVAQAYGGATAFGFNGSNYFGVISALSDLATGNLISSGCVTKGRASVSSGVVSSISEWEPGSGYVASSTGYTIFAPALTVTDPNVTTTVQTSQRTSNGVLSSPSFFNKGNGYNSNSTVVLVSGAGFADQYQTGLTVILNNLSRLPSPGDNLTIAGITQIYKVTSAYPVYGTSVPNLEANVAVSPAITTANATANGTIISIRTKYSQARLTNHDFLYIGSGDLINSQYPATSNALSYPNNQTVEANYGRVFYTSTDQDGNFKVGSLFGVQQATGIVTLSASQFGLSGLTTLSLGGISVGGSSVVVTQFSTDSTFSANSDAVVSTQKAIKTYLTSRLSQGGSNTFTGQLTAGTIVVGAPNFIKSTIPNGTTGSNVKMTSKINFAVIPGSLSPSVNLNINVDGNMAALDFFIRHSTHRSS